MICNGTCWNSMIKNWSMPWLGNAVTLFCAVECNGDAKQLRSGLLCHTWIKDVISWTSWYWENCRYSIACICSFHMNTTFCAHSVSWFCISVCLSSYRFMCFLFHFPFRVNDVFSCSIGGATMGQFEFDVGAVDNDVITGWKVCATTGWTTHLSGKDRFRTVIRKGPECPGIHHIILSPKKKQTRKYEKCSRNAQIGTKSRSSGINGWTMWRRSARYGWSVGTTNNGRKPHSVRVVQEKC